MAWRGVFMFSFVALSYSWVAIWISEGEDNRAIISAAKKQQGESKPQVEDKPQGHNPPATQQKHTVPKPTVKAIELNLRERGLHLSEEIESFVQNRDSKAPPGMVRPEWYAVGGGATPDTTPQYMRDTLALFLKQYESSVIDMRDEFAVRGLHDVALDSSSDHLPGSEGNIHGVLYEMAKSIRKLALLTPPDDLFKGVSDDRLYQLAVNQAEETERRERQAFAKLQDPQRNKNAERFFFYNEFRDCCLKQITYLRAEIFRRVGPSAADRDEMLYFNGPNIGITDMQSDSSISAVHMYMPKFRELAAKLKAQTAKQP